MTTTEAPPTGVPTPVAERRARGGSEPDPAVRSETGRPVRWWLALSGLTLLGLGVRLATVYGLPMRHPGGDPFSYYRGAILLAGGHGFINAWLYYGHGLHLHFQSAQYPPLWTALLSLPVLVGLKSFFALRVWACGLGALAIPVAGGLTRHLLGGAPGRRAGLVAALLAAVYPNLWLSNEQLMSETTSPLLLGLVLLAAYRLWRSPSTGRAAALGLALGAATLGRDELALLALLVLPLALLSPRLSWPQRLGRSMAAAGGFILLVGPWVGYNMVRFDQPVFISTGLGNTLASANCATTYHGPKAGYWSLDCALAAPHDPYQDASVTSSQAQAYALRFIRSHEAELPRVIFEREGRTFGFWEPDRQIRSDWLVETRPLGWARVGLYSYYLLVALAVPGVIVLRRRSVPIYPLLAVAADVAVSVALTLGQTRYRSSFELSLVVLAAIGASQLALTTRRPSPDAPPTATT